MEIELSSIKNEGLKLDTDFKIDLNVYKSNEIRDLKNLHVKGTLKINAIDALEVNLTVTGVMILNDSVTLEKIEYPFTSEIEEEYDLNDPNFREFYQKQQNTLDILEILWENIVLEVPIRLTKSEDAYKEGEGWSLGGNENKNREIDPRLAKLSELLGEREE